MMPHINSCFIIKYQMLSARENMGRAGYEASVFKEEWPIQGTVIVSERKSAFGFRVLF